MAQLEVPLNETGFAGHASKTSWLEAVLIGSRIRLCKGRLSRSCHTQVTDEIAGMDLDQINAKGMVAVHALRQRKEHRHRKKL